MKAGYTHKSFEPICQTFKNEQVIVARPNSAFHSAHRSHRRRQGQAGRPQLRPPRRRDDPASGDDRVRANGEGRIQPGAVQGAGRSRADDPCGADRLRRGAAIHRRRPAGCACRALFAPARNPAIPAVPTMKEQGFDVAPLSFGALVGARRAAGGGQAQARRRLQGGGAQPTPMPRVARSAFQPDDYYGDSATLARNLDQDVAEKTPPARRRSAWRSDRRD